MNIRASWCWLLIGALSTMWLPGSASAERLKPAEKAKIEALIEKIERLEDATFIRNGRKYGSDTAGRFLRGKWKAMGKKIETAREFIDKIARASSTTGRIYRIRFKDGSEVPCGEFLGRELQLLESGPSSGAT